MISLKSISTERVLPALLVYFLLLSATAPAQSAQYTVDGLTLGEKVSGPTLQSYSCKPSEEFARLTSCSRAQTRNRGYNYTASSTILQKDDGAAVYLMINVAPVSLTKKDVQKEIDELSREIGGQPASVDWQDPSSDRPTSVIVRWGQIKLVTIDFDTSEVVAAGKNPKIGALVGALGDVQRSAKSGLDVYRISGGTGYIYSASFDNSGRGNRQYIAANGDELVVRQYEVALPGVLAKDQSLDAKDLKLWPDVADMTRRLARDTSPKIANETLDRVFENVQSKKFRSHVWALLPGGAIQHLTIHQHWDVDIYGPQTEHPKIRSDIETFLAGKPSDPFVEFLYYVIGEYDEALRVNPKSELNDVLHYASGFKILGTLLHDTIQIVKAQTRKDVVEPPEIYEKMVFLITNQDLFDNKPLSTVVPNFAERAAPARKHFEEVLRDTKAPHADDAAFILGWLTLHEGKTREEALPYFSKAMVVGNGDYKDQPGAVGRVLRILERLTSREQLGIVDADSVFSRQPALAYVAARSAYREYNYAATMEAAIRYLKAMSVQPELLPITTDPQRIDKALEKFDFEGTANLREIPYILQASKELSQYETFIRGAATQQPDAVIKKARTIIIKYSKLLDGDDNEGRPVKKAGLPEFAHKDLRQAIHLIDLTLANTSKTPPYARLREWLYYRKARVSAVFAPDTIPEVFAVMSAEFPASKLLDDVLAEQLFAQGFMKKDLNAAQVTFRKLITDYPNGNAVDNAYSWMAIILRCQGQIPEAEKMNREIIRRYPLTRHAAYAKARLADPKTCTAQTYAEEERL
jgi:tetratricopeptide (TPR) repeat protein